MIRRFCRVLGFLFTVHADLMAHRHATKIEDLVCARAKKLHDALGGLNMTSEMLN